MSSNYFIVGTKYDGHSDRFQRMIELDAVGVGSFGEHDLSDLYGASEETIVSDLKKRGAQPKQFNNLKRFLSIRSGDFIAIKRSGSPTGNKARLIIGGYAVAQERNGKLYQHDPKGLGHLGHLIFVKFLETENNREFQLGYGKAVHKLTNQSHIREIFSEYYRE